MKYDYLFNEYPSIITMEQVRIILRVSKRKAKWILDNGYIKNTNSGKKTRKYSIQLNDLVSYLINVDKNSDNYPIPKGCFSSICGHTPPTINYGEKQKKQLRLMLEKTWNTAPDALKINDVPMLIGYNREAVLSWVEKGKLKSVWNFNIYIIPKEWLIDCIVDMGYSGIQKKSKIHMKFLNELSPM